MAKPSWLTVNPESGSGNSTLANTATAHTGRVARTGTVSVQGVGVTDAKTYAVTQSPLAEFVSFDDGDNAAIAKAGGTLTLTGLTNSESLTFALGTGDIEVTLPTSYTANGGSTTNGADISGDPGADSQFAYSISLTIPENTSVSSKTKILTVTAEGGQAQQITITQAAGDATLTLSETAITIPQDGSAVSVSVTSNTSWTVS